jgi:Ca2+-transporting ATPase
VACAHTDPALGLTAAEAARRLARDGPNELPEPPRPSLQRLLLAQLAEPLVAVLLAVCGLTLVVLREVLEAVAIVVIVAIDVVIGASQERSAGRAVDALASLVAPGATVRRDGRTLHVPAAEVVLGDIVELAAGDRVPADAVLLPVTGADLEVDEAPLTGESLPVRKEAGAPGARGASPSDRRGEVFAGTHVVRGRGLAQVEATGQGTEVGRIATALATTTPTPLERDLDAAARVIGLLAAGIGLALAAATYVRAGGGGEALVDAALVGVALAVAAVPEGLAAVVTVALALGARRMADRGAIVRQLDAVEALGAADVLCSDKTGTLTRGELDLVETEVPPSLEDDFWRVAFWCNDASDGVGDPIDVVLAEGAARRGTPPVPGPRLAERPFDARWQLQAVVHGSAGEPHLSVKGSPAAVLARCASGPEVDRLLHVSDSLAARGLRVLALADGRAGDPDATGLRPLGLAVFGDELRDSSRAAVLEARRGGMRVMMVTGDHPATAAAIAEAAGIPIDRVVAGAELVALERAAAWDRLAEADVVARVTPEVKVALVDALQDRGHVVAMTGDGVNDAPALVAADIGVAVSVGPGTAVAREAADLLITDGDLSTLVAAVREGRRIFRNLVSVTAYLLSGNVAEVATVAGALVLLPELAIPLTAVQLLWINVVTDGFPALALGVDDPPGDPLAERPRARDERLLDRRRLAVIGGRGATLAASLLVLAAASLAAGSTDRQVGTQLLLGLVLGQLILPFVVRSQRWCFERGWWRNRTLDAVVGASLVVQVLVFLLPAGREVLGLAALDHGQWAAAVLAVAAAVLAMEAARALVRWIRK